jgi:hypothetical protein
VAHRVISLQSSASVAFGEKRTSTSRQDRPVGREWPEGDIDALPFRARFASEPAAAREKTTSDLEHLDRDRGVRDDPEHRALSTSLPRVQ